MWKDPEPDPGGNTPESSSSGQSLQELSDLKDQNEQQQLLIAQLKEMLRKEQINVPQEKVEEYINTLSKVKVKRTRLKKDDSGGTERSASSSSLDIYKKGKLNLLKQQLEENKARLAERGKNQKGIEEMVTQLKAQLNDSQQLIPTNLTVQDPKPHDYSKDSTQEELYNILLNKERQITDLIERSRKQEVTILDLQENLKEKDSVIDARTKAITLMTESLSKKGKSTLDALDDTKEQMRQMQETFVTLESEMKARQQKLLNDLKAKNFEIADLQESNQKLTEEKSEFLNIIDEYKKVNVEGQENQTEFYKNHIRDLQEQLEGKNSENEANVAKIEEQRKQLEESIEEINKLKNGVSAMENSEDVISGLKKQLDDNNKSITKMKAQSKSKIKELTRKIDQFKKSSDTNALIVQLQTENTKLSEKIAELEEEKGNLQLKMIDSTESLKDSAQIEEHKKLETKLERNEEELAEKDKIIALLELDIITLKEEIQVLSTSNVSHSENVQVTTEMNSIQIEEQLEKKEGENLDLKREIEVLIKEKEEMAENIEELKKEKQEISSKLDSYIQENMELIDKLEKLSAEKVSSVESIEIVEGLTQQEKLELAAYQKNLDLHSEGEPIKCSEDDNIEPPVELNESVMQLSEDSTELLQKIDMFNMERKEVMSKMETLREENSQLGLKIKEIENNRDILAETYEQVQTEKELLQNENDDLLKKLRMLEEGNSLKTDARSITLELQELQNKYEELLAENEELKRTLKSYDKVIHEKHNLDIELSRAKEKIEELESNIETNMEELTNYQSVIEENKDELINSATIINDLHNKLRARETDISDLNVIINDLNGVVGNLQRENTKLGNFELMETQVAELRTALDDQIQQALDYEEEIARNNDIIEELNTKLFELNRKILETEHEMDVKNIEAKKMAQDLQNKDEAIRNLQSQVEERDRKINLVVQDMKEKYLTLQKQLDGNSGSLETKVAELTNKNKEQLEKMKKIAANLKKKTQAYQELEEKYNGEKEKWETEVNEKESVIADSKGRIASILQQLKDLEEEVYVKGVKLAEAEQKTHELTEVIQNLEQNKVELQNFIVELKHKEEKLNEVNLKQELSTSLHEEFDDIPSNQSSAQEEKIKELEMIIETNEADLAHYNERIHKLEEDISRLEQEKEDAERNALELSEQLKITSKSAEEKTFLEEELEQKLLQVTANDEEIMKKLTEVTEENKDLTQKNKELEELTLKLKVKVKKAHEKVTQLKSLQSTMEELETTNAELIKQVAALEVHQKHIQDENEELQKQNRNDYEKIEADYQIQMEELVKCKNDLTVECEKLQETLREMEGREEELLSEIAEYRQKMEQNESNNQEQIQQLTEELRAATDNWKDSVREIESLNQQIEALQSQLVVKVAKDTVEELISRAQETVVVMNTVASQTEKFEDEQEVAKVENTNQSQLETVPTFHWPADQSNQNQNWFIDVPGQDLSQQNQEIDWFAEQKQSSSNVPQDDWSSRGGSEQPNPLPAVENTKEELLNKIKALEFLLYNVDKEKDEALEECTGMVKELTHLVYDKINTPKAGIVRASESVPSLSEVESQVMSSTDVADAAASKKELQRIEFETTDVSLGEQTRPVVEEVAQPKRAYLTYQPEDKVPKLEAFGENDDGWGWGPEEAKLEEEHLHKTEGTPQMQHLKSEIAHLNERIQVLQVERENHLEEIKQLQVKSGKLIKKCKELKQKCDLATQSKKSEMGDFDLDETIQEEFKTQITQLEKKIKELTSEMEKERIEKSNILKRVDVLTAANERMLEMKEIQDTEVLRWKRKHLELEEKFQQQEWGSDGFNEGTKPKTSVESDVSASDNKKIEELQQTIKELALDNEELQALLDEQRQLRINAERAKSVSEPPKIDNSELVALEEKLKVLEQELWKKSEELEGVLEQKNQISTNYEQLQQIIREKEEIVGELGENLRITTEKYNESAVLLADQSKLVRDLQETEKAASAQQELLTKIGELENNLLQITESKVQQELLLNEKDVAYNELLLSFNQISAREQELNIQVAQLSYELEQQRLRYEQLQLESTGNSSELQEKLKQLSEKYDQLQAEKESRISQLSGEVEQLEQQKQMFVQKEKENEEKLEELSKEIQRLGTEYAGKVAELEQLSSKSNEADTFEIATQKYQLESLLAEKEGDINELNSLKLELEDEVRRLRQNLEDKEKGSEQLKNEMDERIATVARELEESWAAQVDQRGADVAESWKLHLETVETDFAALQEKLRLEINELEEKCNALVNENNELRKNVDAEIRNEVDRISALQQQISDHQRYNTELNNTLIEKQNENESLIGKLTALESEVEQLQNENANTERRLAGLNIVLETTQAQFDEKREVVEEIVRILEKNASRTLSYEKQDVLNEFQRQLDIVTEKEQEILTLNQLLQSLQSQVSFLQEKDAEIYRLTQLVEDLQTQLVSVQGKDEEISRLNRLVEESQTQLFKVHEKDTEIFNLNKLVQDLQEQLATSDEKYGEVVSLKKIIEDLQTQIGALQGKEEEILRLNQIIGNYKVQEDIDQQELSAIIEEQEKANLTITDYKQKLDEYKATHTALHNSIEEKNQLIATLNQQLQLTESLRNDNNKDVEKLQEEITETKNDCAVLQDSLSECQQQLFSVTSELTSKNNQLETVNQQLYHTQQCLEIQEGELNKLKEALQAKELEYAASIENVRKTQLRDLENHYEEVIAAKDLDIASVRSQLNESIQNSHEMDLEVNLRQQLEEKVKQLEEKTAEQAVLLDEENKQVREMAGIIEEQVIKIEELKKELFEKSSDFDSIIAEMDIGRNAITQQPTPSTSVIDITAPSKRQRALEEDDLSEPVSRAELDLALYMLHQRDVRCEELTVELTQLLEERDTLQLRLSNAIREREEIRKLTGTEDVPVPSSSSAPLTPLSKSSAIFLAASGTELATEPTETISGIQVLENKLSELKRVGYKKDKTFVDEQELRRLQQISILQQHINEASKLPPEAAAKLVDASYTLSRDVQSPSKVLLNWLWGRSTPKVNDT